MSTNLPLHNRVRELRLARGWSQQCLAERTCIARTTISAIESDRLTPSVDAALSLAEAFECQVDEVFYREPAKPRRVDWAWPPRSEPQRFWQAEINGRMLLYPCEATPMGTLAHDGIAEASPASATRRDAPDTLVIACCDPAVGLLAAELAGAAGVRLIALHRSSRDALALVHQGLVHVAGCHLGALKGLGNRSVVRSALGAGYMLVRYAEWSEGVATADHRPQSLDSIIKSKPRWVGREHGSGARHCLDELLGTGIRYRHTARDHRGVADAIRSGWADAGVCLQIAADEANLHFTPLRTEPYDLCCPIGMVNDRRIRGLLQVLQSATFQRQLAELPGYRTARSGATTTT